LWLLRPSTFSRSSPILWRAGHVRKSAEPLKLNGHYIIPAPVPVLWDAITDPILLTQCIPGCEAVARVHDTLYTGQIRAQVGPVKAVFKGQLTLEDMRPPHHYTMVVQGKGGMAGLAKARSEVVLTPLDDPRQTKLEYTATTELSGLIDRLASRLLTGTAYKYVDGFFERFIAVVQQRQASLTQADKAQNS